MNAGTTNSSGREDRYLQRSLPGFGYPPMWTDFDGDTDVRLVVEAVVAAEPDDEELALIIQDRHELGYLTPGHIGAVLTWARTRALSTTPLPQRPLRCAACHRPLTDDLSRRRGFGPVCCEKGRRGVR